jgi:hypothetical protein
VLVKYAIALARRDMAVFPCEVRGKAPLTEHGCKDATTDLEIVERWWSNEPNANIGIATGKPSHAFVIDVDGSEGEASLAKLEAEFGALPNTVESVTGGGGRHLFFEWPGIPIRNSVGRIGPGLDIRGDGGYVVAPPSVHPTGRAYCWSVDSATSLAHAPAWLRTKANGSGGGNGHNGRAGPTPPSEWRAMVRDGVSEGARNSTVARLAGHLLRQRIDPLVVLELLRAWNATSCQPPLDDSEVERTVNSICASERRRRGGPI